MSIHDRTSLLLSLRPVLYKKIRSSFQKFRKYSFYVLISNTALISNSAFLAISLLVSNTFYHAKSISHKINKRHINSAIESIDAV